MRPYLPAFIFIFISYLSIALLDSLFITSLSKFSAYGMKDYKEYWSAFQLVLIGQNPYDPQIMKDFQIEKFGNEIPLMMWNPPWILLLLAPILTLSFEASAYSYLLIQIILSSVSILLIFSIYNSAYNSGIFNDTDYDIFEKDFFNKKFIFWVIIPTVIFTPLLNSFLYGQIGALLLFGVCLVFYGIINLRVNFFSIGLVLLSLKPHLFLVLLFFIAWWILRNKKYKFILYPFIYFSIILLSLYLIAPSLLNWWLISFSQLSDDIVPSSYKWIPCNFSGAIQNYLYPEFVLYKFLLPVVISIFLMIFIIRKKLINVGWYYFYPVLLFLSVYFSPYGWFFDQSIFLIIHILTLLIAYRSNSLFLIVLSVFLQILSHLYMHLYLEYLVEMFWFAPILIAIFSMAYYKKNIRRKTAR